MNSQEQNIRSYLEDISILYVEDDMNLRNIVSRYLNEITEKVYTAKDGRDGFQVYREKKPDIIISDIMMPVMSGIDMSRRIKEIDENAKIILTTAFCEVEYLLEAIDIGINQYLLKPVKQDKLYSAVYKCTDLIRYERKLKEKREFIDKLYWCIEQGPAMFLITDSRGRIEYVNQKFTKVTGYSHEDIMGKKTDILMAEQNISGLYEQLWATVQNGDEWRGEAINKTKDGNLYPVSFSVSPMRTYEGNIGSYVFVYEDMTGQKKIEDINTAVDRTLRTTTFFEELQKLQGIKILLVQSLLISQIAIGKIFKKLGCYIEVADNGIEAYETFLSNKYDIVFMDVDLPLMDGFSVAKKIRDFEKNKKSEGDYKRVPIICLTSHREKGFYEECIKNGMDDYMTKPVLKEKLIEILNKWINKM